MHGLIDILLSMMLLPVVPAFLVRLCIDWRSYQVGVVVSAVTAAIFIGSSFQAISLSPGLLQMYLFGLFLGIVGGVVGSGVARLLLAIAQRD